MFDLLVQALDLQSKSADDEQVICEPILTSDLMLARHPKLIKSYKEFRVTRGNLRSLLFGKA